MRALVDPTDRRHAGTARTRGGDAPGLAGALGLLAALLAANAVLGPLLTGVIDYRYGPSMTNQGIGLDAVALLAAVPLAVVAAVLVRRGRRPGPVLALAPGAFAAYMAPQYVVGPDYLGLPGNNERFLLLHLALLVTGAAVVLLAWAACVRAGLPAGAGPDRRLAAVLAGVAAFILLRWLPAVAALTAGAPPPAAYLDDPTAFLLVGVLDLGLVTPAAVAAAAGLWLGTGWARRAAYAVIGWFALVPASVAAMAVTMVARDDPQGSVRAAAGFTVAAVVFLAAAAALYRPLFRRSAGR